MSLEMDRKHEVPEAFLRNFVDDGVELRADASVG